MSFSSIYVLMMFCTVIICQAQDGTLRTKVKGTGKYTSQRLTTATYDEIEVYGKINVNLILGAEGFINAQGEKNLLTHVRARVENNILKISTDTRYNLIPTKGKELVVYIPFEKISAFSFYGDGTVRTAHSIESEKLRITFLGSGDYTLDLNTTELTAEIGGVGYLELTGETDIFTIKSNGSGDIDAFKFRAKKGNISYSGSGDAEVFCSESINAESYGNGYIRFKGNPILINTTVYGSGEILQIK